MKLFNLTGLRALITGGAGSIGLRTATALATQGADVVIADIRQDALQTAINKIKSETGIKANGITCNLSDFNETQELFNKVEDNYGPIDILVNNAGIDKDKLLMRMSIEDLDIVMNINFKAAFILSKSAILSMVKRKFGRIINISSVVAYTGNPGQANYCASKAALLGFTRAVALEYAQRGITANCIAPGAIRTPMTDAISQEVQEAFIKKIPVGHMGSPDDIANTVAFLSSKESSYITGQTIQVNGGMNCS